jgi:hypothetical protein
MNAVNVENPFARRQTSGGTKALTQGKNPISVLNVEKPSTRN